VVAKTTSVTTTTSQPQPPERTSPQQQSALSSERTQQPQQQIEEDDQEEEEEPSRLRPSPNKNTERKPNQVNDNNDDEEEEPPALVTSAAPLETTTTTITPRPSSLTTILQDSPDAMTQQVGLVRSNHQQQQSQQFDDDPTDIVEDTEIDVELEDTFVGGNDDALYQIKQEPQPFDMSMEDSDEKKCSMETTTLPNHKQQTLVQKMSPNRFLPTSTIDQHAIVQSPNTSQLLPIEDEFDDDIPEDERLHVQIVVENDDDDDNEQDDPPLQSLVMEDDTTNYDLDYCSEVEVVVMQGNNSTTTTTTTIVNDANVQEISVTPSSPLKRPSDPVAGEKWQKATTEDDDDEEEEEANDSMVASPVPPNDSPPSLYGTVEMVPTDEHLSRKTTGGGTPFAVEAAVGVLMEAKILNLSDEDESKALVTKEEEKEETVHEKEPKVAVETTTTMEDPNGPPTIALSGTGGHPVVASAGSAFLSPPGGFEDTNAEVVNTKTTVPVQGTTNFPSQVSSSDDGIWTIEKELARRAEERQAGGRTLGVAERIAMLHDSFNNSPTRSQGKSSPKRSPTTRQKQSVGESARPDRTPSFRGGIATPPPVKRLNPTRLNDSFEHLVGIEAPGSGEEVEQCHQPARVPDPYDDQVPEDEGRLPPLSAKPRPPLDPHLIEPGDIPIGPIPSEKKIPANVGRAKQEAPGHRPADPYDDEGDSVQPMLIKPLDNDIGIPKGDIVLSLLNPDKTDEWPPKRVDEAIWRCRTMRRQFDSFWEQEKQEHEAEGPSKGRIPISLDGGKNRDGGSSLASTQHAAIEHLKFDDLDDALCLYEDMLEIYDVYFAKILKKSSQKSAEQLDKDVKTYKLYVGVAQHNVGIVHLLRQEFSEAFTYFERAALNRESSLGAGHPDHIVSHISTVDGDELKLASHSHVALLLHDAQSSLIKMAMCRFALSDFEASDSALREALGHCRSSLKTLADRRQLAEILNNLGCLSYMVGETGEAMKLLEESMDIQTETVNLALYAGSKFSCHTASLNSSVTKANIGLICLVMRDNALSVAAFEAALRVSG